ncbi:MAG: barstar family protein [Methylococcaceae bacterium]
MNALPMMGLPNQLIKIFPTQIASFFIDGDVIEDKQTFLTEFAEKLKFPDYFGMNWDAFSDCLTDLSWIDSANDFLIVYKNSQKFRTHQPEDWQIANGILLEAMDYWNEQGKKMVIVLL